MVSVPVAPGPTPYSRKTVKHDPFTLPDRFLHHAHLITITGKSDAPGRPMLYGTTQKFLERFGLPPEQALDALVRRLRERLASVDPQHTYLITVRGHGLRLDNPPRAP